MRFFVYFSVFFLLVSVEVFSVNSELGRVEWTKNGPIVYSKGIGAVNPQMPLAVQRPAVIEAAKVVGLRNVLEIIKGINLNSETTIENQMLSDDIIIKTMSGSIKNYSVGEPKYFSDGTVEVEIKVPLYGNKELMNTLLKLSNESDVTLKVGKEESKPFTGLIVNCEDLNVLPALTVKITAENGDVVYSSSVVNDDYLFQMEGMVAYTATVGQAKAMEDRVGKNPLIVKASKVVGDNHSDIVISESDVKILLGNKKNIKCLEECRVIFISKNF